MRTPVEQAAPGIDQAVRKINRGVTFARASGLTLLSLGGLSAVFCLTDPRSVSFAIAIAVLANGLIEYRAAGALARRHPGALSWLAWNQIALGLEIALYALVQARGITAEGTRALLDQAAVTAALAVYPPEQQRLLAEILPGALRMLYCLVGTVALAGCGGCALFYRSRGKYLGAVAAIRSH